MHSVTATSVSYNVEDETITLEFPTVLHVATSWILDISYVGLVNERLNGFYRSAYTDADNNVQYVMLRHPFIFHDFNQLIFPPF